jgi:hypothetical protein
MGSNHRSLQRPLSVRTQGRVGIPVRLAGEFDDAGSRRTPPNTLDTVSPARRKRLSLLRGLSAILLFQREGIVVSASYYGDPMPSAERHANQVGQIDLGREKIETPGYALTVHVSGANVDRSRLAWIHGPVMLNVNVYSARRRGPDNILNCDFFDGKFQDATGKPLALHCSLITEKAESDTNSNLIPPNRAADSYAIYSLLTPGAPDDKIAPTQVQNWSIAETTVNITDMNPAVPPDGALKAPPDNPEAFNEALQDFNARKYQRFRLQAASFSGHNVSLIDQQQVIDRRRTASGSSGIAFFSAVYFNNNQTAALVYVNDWCANLCSAGQWVYLEKHGGQWVRRSGIISGGA